MTSFLGEYEVAVDAKGRFLLPAAFRKQLPAEQSARFVINRGFEHCLTLYPMEIWEVISEKINRLNDFDARARDFKRLFLNGATIIDLDSAGRILLPKPLQEFAGINKEMIFSAQGKKVELWDKDTFRTYIAGKQADYSSLAAAVAGSDFNPFENV